MKKNIIIRMTAAFIAIVLLFQLASCESYPRKILRDEDNCNTRTIILLKKGEPRCNLSVSGEVMEQLLNENKELLDKMARYFNLLSDDSVDSNIIYINSRISKYMEGFTAYDKNTYIKAKNNLKMDLLNLLKYRDYYVSVEEESILVVCNSVSMTINVLETMYDKYFSQGVEQNGDYIITVPRYGIYNGTYLKGVGIAGTPIKDYSIVYPSLINSSEGCVAAKYLYDYLYENCGISIPLLLSDDTENVSNKYEIIVGDTSKKVCAEYYDKKPGLGDYKVIQEDNSLYILGGSDWAMQYAIDIFIRDYFSKELSIPEGYTISGNIYGKYLFEKYTGSNLRIISQNIWNNDANSAVWKAAGLNCSLSSRLKGFATVFMAYNPDIICLQESKNRDKVNEMIAMMNNQGRSYKLITGVGRMNYTPVIYNTDTLTLIKAGYSKFGDSGASESKSFTWAYFKHKQTGKCFIAVSTHLWWMSLMMNPFSGEVRQSQFEKIIDCVDKLLEQYNCPCFVVGDMNCNINTDEYQFALKSGFTDCYDIAEEFADNVSGRFECSQSIYSNQPQVGSYKNAIDHALVKNIGNSRVISYDYITPNFFGKLSDHAPLCLDICL